MVLRAKVWIVIGEQVAVTRLQGLQVDCQVAMELSYQPSMHLTTFLATATPLPTPLKAHHILVRVLRHSSAVTLDMTGIPRAPGGCMSATALTHCLWK